MYKFTQIDNNVLNSNPEVKIPDWINDINFEKPIEKQINISPDYSVINQRHVIANRNDNTAYTRDIKLSFNDEMLCNYAKTKLSLMLKNKKFIIEAQRVNDKKVELDIVFEKNPANMSYYLKSGNGLSYDERKELRAFLEDPANQEELKAAVKGIKNSILKARPTFKTGAINHLKSIIENCDYSGGDLQDLMEKEYRDSHKSYYQGGNDRDCEASAIIGLIMKVINKIYGFEIWSSITSDKDEYENEIISAHINGLNKEDQTYEQFVDDADNLKFTIKKLGVSKKKESSTVHNSSFTSNYNYDFEVICTKKGEEIFHETITDVTIGSYFFSGGW
jgi:hypothetical protein